MIEQPSGIGFARELPDLSPVKTTTGRKIKKKHAPVKMGRPGAISIPAFPSSTPPFVSLIFLTYTPRHRLHGGHPQLLLFVLLRLQLSRPSRVLPLLPLPPPLSPPSLPSLLPFPMSNVAVAAAPVPACFGFVSSGAMLRSRFTFLPPPFFPHLAAAAVPSSSSPPPPPLPRLDRCRSCSIRIGCSFAFLSRVGRK